MTSFLLRLLGVEKRTDRPDLGPVTAHSNPYLDPLIRGEDPYAAFEAAEQAKQTKEASHADARRRPAHRPGALQELPA
jgi:hypothetical protein